MTDVAHPLSTPARAFTLFSPILKSFCNIPFTVNGNFSSWSGFSACSVTCGNGTMTRFRECNNPAPAHGGADCHGNATETVICKEQECPSMLV